MKKYYLIYVFTLLSSNIFSQNKTFIITNELKQNKESKVFEVNKRIIKTKKFEKKEVDNPKYLEAISKIDSLNNQIKNIKGGKLTESQKKYLMNGYYYLKDAIKYQENNNGEIDIFGEKWVGIRKGKKELDKSGIEFKQTIRKKYSIAIDEAKQNIAKIENMLGLSTEKRREIARINQQISEIRNKINSPFHPIKKKIYKDVVVGEIEREALMVGTKNVYSDIVGKFVPIKNNQYNNDYRLMKQDYKGFVKNELVSGNVIEKVVEDKIGSLKNLNKITDNIDTYVYRDENDHSYYHYSNNKYLIKNIETNKIYYTTDNILDKVAIENDKYSLLTFLKENNIEVFEKNNKEYVRKDGVECVLSEYVKKELLNKNLNIIQQTASAVKHYNKYYDEAIKLLDIITKHRQAYNFRTMTKSRLAKCKTDLKKLIYVKKKMDDIHFGKYKNNKKSDLAYQYFINFNKQLTREQVDGSSVISDMISECKIITGL